MMSERKMLEIEFNRENQAKKNIAQSARKRVGRRRGCSFLPRTKAELQAMSGPCTTYRLNEPMKWKTFTQIPKHIQAEYLRSLAIRFHATEAMLPSLLGATPTAVQTYLTNRGLSGMMAASCKGQAPDMDAWTAFTNQLWHPDAGAPVIEAISTLADSHDIKRGIPREKEADNKGELSKLLHELLQDFESKNSLAAFLGVSRMLVARGLNMTLSASSTASLLDVVRQAPAKKHGAESDTWTKVSEVTMTMPGGVNITTEKEPDPSEVLSFTGTVKSVMETMKVLLSRKGGEAVVTISIHTR